MLVGPVLSTHPILFKGNNFPSNDPVFKQILTQLREHASFHSYIYIYIFCFIFRERELQEILTIGWRHDFSTIFIYSCCLRFFINSFLERGS